MSKWSFLVPIAQAAKKETPYITNAELARQVLSKYSNLMPEGATEDSVRIAISRILNADEPPLEVVSHELEHRMWYGNKEAKTIRKSTFTTPGMYLVLGCIHVPGHNVAMVNGITELLGDYRRGIQGLMLIGDFLDLNSLSGHDRSRFTAIPGLNLNSEYEAGNKVLDQFTEALTPKTEKVYLYGNHEDRWNRYMSDMQNAKTPLASPQEALKLDHRGFYTFTNWKSDYIKLGEHLELVHGQYYNTHCAKQHIDKFRGSVMFAHTHRIQMYVEGRTGGFNIGWGGDINSPLFNYAERGTKSQWQNGFAIVTVDEYGDYFVQQIFCHNNKFYFNNKKYA